MNVASVIVQSPYTSYCSLGDTEIAYRSCPHGNDQGCAAQFPPQLESVQWTGILRQADAPDSSGGLGITAKLFMRKMQSLRKDDVLGVTMTHIEGDRKTSRCQL